MSEMSDVCYLRKPRQTQDQRFTFVQHVGVNLLV